MIETDNKLIGMAVFVIALILSIAWAVTAAGANAEVEAGKVAVFVIDEKGNAVENATVQLISNTSQIVKSGITDKDGKVVFDMGTTANFTGIVKVTADGYKAAQENITYNNTKGYSYLIQLKKDTSGYIDKAKDIYNEHKTAVLVGGAVIILLLVLAVMGNSKKIRW